jgi:hypothetical protein
MTQTLSITDSYYLTRNFQSDFSMPGYKAAKTPVPLKKSLGLTKSKRSELFPFLQQKSAEPSPTSYADGHFSFLKASWTPSGGKFAAAKKMTMTERITKANQDLPGPGKYIMSRSSFSRSFGKFG